MQSEEEVVIKKYDRKNNPKGLVKPLEEHIELFKKRLIEKFNIEITDEEYHELVANISYAKPIYSLNNQTSIFSMIIKGIEVWVIYGNACDRIEARLKTALAPYKKYLVPDVFDDQYNCDQFTDEVNKTVEYFKKVSTELDLNNKKEFFMRTDLPQLVKTAACKFKEHPETTKLTLVSMAIKYITHEEVA